MEGTDLETTIGDLLSPGKGILAADESLGTIAKRFARIEIESTPEARRAYREVLFTTPGIEDYVSGVILFDETIRQSAGEGTRFVDLLAARGIVPGIKVDKGAKPLALHGGETITEGLDGLRERLQEYRSIGARFAKWRAVLRIGPTIPSRFCIEANATALARYAALCQESAIVPIVEPEVLIDGEHDMARCEEVTTSVLASVFEQLRFHRVTLEHTVLKPNMVLPGKGSSQRLPAEQIAAGTLRALRRSVPAAVPMVAFLSGGQEPVEATKNLDAINRAGAQPWRLTFSFSRALQDPVLRSWRGREDNRVIAQQTFLHRARCAAEASRGRYTVELESEATMEE